MKPRRPEVRVSLETALWMSTSAALLAAIIAGAVSRLRRFNVRKKDSLRPSASTIRKTVNSFLTHKRDSEYEVCSPEDDGPWHVA